MIGLKKNKATFCGESCEELSKNVCFRSANESHRNAVKINLNKAEPRKDYEACKKVEQLNNIKSQSGIN